MAVAASNKKWLPDFFAFVGRLGFQTSQDSPLEDSEHETSKPSGSDAPLNAILLSTVLSALYILLGNFRALVTFNGLGEYSFFFLTVVGAIILRFREPNLQRPYKPFLLVPLVFAAVSGFVVVRGAIFAPMLALVLIVVWGLGLGFYHIRARLAQGDASREEQEH